jgi:hypothetical protein
MPSSSPASVPAAGPTGAMGKPAASAGRERRHRMTCRGGSEGVRAVKATAGKTVAAPMVRCDVVVVPPTAIRETVGFIVIHPGVAAVRVSAIRTGTA